MRCALRRPGRALDSASANYRLGRLLFEQWQQTCDTALHGEVVRVLTLAASAARAARAHKLARNANRSLAAALLLHGATEATQQHLVAALVHSSVGQASLAHFKRTQSKSWQEQAVKHVDAAVDSCLKSGQDSCTCDELTRDLPRDWVVCCVARSPTGHLLLSRLQVCSLIFTKTASSFFVGKIPFWGYIMPSF